MPSISRLGGATDATSDEPIEDQIKRQNPEVKSKDVETVVVNDENEDLDTDDEDDEEESKPAPLPAKKSVPTPPVKRAEGKK